MASEQTTVAVVTLATTILPSVISLFQALFVRQNPGVPPPTDAEVMAAFAGACATSLATDADWLAAHPKG